MRPAYLYIVHVGLHHVQAIFPDETLHQTDALIVGSHLSFQVADVVIEVACACERS